MRVRFCLLVLLGFLLNPQTGQAACDDPAAHKATTPAYILSFKSDPAISVGRAFSLLVDVCNADGTAFAGTLEADAHMPQHRHGMNYAPEIKVLGDGRFRVDGFLFHMPGQWQFMFDLHQDKTRERLLSDFTVK